MPIGGETPSPNVGSPVPGTPGGSPPNGGQQAPLAEKSGLANRPGQPLAKASKPGLSKGVPAKKTAAKKAPARK